MIRPVAALALIACSAPPSPISAPLPAVASSDPLLRAIEAADLGAAMRVLCEAYAAGGMPCSETLTLAYLAPDDMMSRLDDHHGVHMTPPPPPAGGFAYWERWSKILADGAWAPRALFRDDAHARRVATMLLVSVLAHELGHHVAEAHGCHPLGDDRELRADELAVPLLAARAKAGGRALDDLHAEMRFVADAMVEATLEARRGKLDATTLPRDVAPYATLHLARQREVLLSRVTFGEMAKQRCLDAFVARLAQRALIPSTVTTRDTWPAAPAAAFAVGGDGTVWRALPIGGDRQLVLEAMGRGTRTAPVTLEPDARGVTALAVASASRWAFIDGTALWIVEDGVARRVGGSLRVSRLDGLAFEYDTLHVGRRDRGWTVVTAAGEVRWKLGPDDATRWGDGPLARAVGQPSKFAIIGGRVVFADAAREAVRAMTDARVVTLAGSRPGRHDGPGADARFFEIAALGAWPHGGVVVVEATPTAITRRIVEVVDAGAE